MRLLINMKGTLQNDETVQEFYRAVMKVARVTKVPVVTEINNVRLTISPVMSENLVQLHLHSAEATRQTRGQA